MNKDLVDDKKKRKREKAKKVEVKVGNSWLIYSVWERKTKN